MTIWKSVWHSWVLALWLTAKHRCTKWLSKRTNLKSLNVKKNFGDTLPWHYKSLGKKWFKHFQESKQKQINNFCNYPYEFNGLYLYPLRWTLLPWLQSLINALIYTVAMFCFFFHFLTLAIGPVIFSWFFSFSLSPSTIKRTVPLGKNVGCSLMNAWHIWRMAVFEGCLKVAPYFKLLDWVRKKYYFTLNHSSFKLLIHIQNYHFRN